MSILWRSRAALLSAGILPSFGGFGWLMAGLQGPVLASVLGTLAIFFGKAGAFVFGSGLAIIPFLYASVTQYHWLTEQQFLDAIAVAMIAPGLVVITAAFIKDRAA